MHVKTEIRINLHRFGGAIIFRQAFLHSDDTLIFNSACVCVHLLVSTCIHKVGVNAEFADLTLALHSHEIVM